MKFFEFFQLAVFPNEFLHKKCGVIYAPDTRTHAAQYDACGGNATKSEPCATDSICSSVATAVVPAAATEVLPAAAPGDSGKVATEVIPAEAAK